ncbi:hypothetical protein SLS60_001775 [Paraconiothyrium brasiliense]|uniref:FAD dependent oxidoreductase domain-containing protein n=1 Tax=Paraconiothyrium brasiliense TaxID=300254 RepID=A0ABR3S0B3_9PLEO
MAHSPDGIYEKGIIDPGTPVANSTKPFWLTEPSPIAKLQSPWVNESDVVIIGSGMTAASLCRTLYAEQPGIKIVLVEARDLCAGATGRNGGHVKAMSPGAWQDRVKTYGLREALKVMEFEHAHVEEILACIDENGIQADHRRIEGLDVYHDEKTWRRAVKAVEDLRKHDPKLGKRYAIYDTRRQLRDLKIADVAVGAIGMPAATMWPYKMVAGLLEKFVKENGLSIQTNTVAISVDENPKYDFATVKTSRGDIRAKNVIHATNAFLGHLVSELRPYVSPVRANVQRQLPRPITHQLTRSYWLRYGEKDYDYMMQRPDGATIIGRGSTGRRATADDSETDLVAHVHLRGATPYVFDWGTDRIEVTHQWSGAVAFTSDGNPFVGRLPFSGSKHQWVCGAYQGIGMVRAFKSAQMAAYLILDKEIPEEYPRSFLTTKERFDGLQAVFKGAKL